MPYATPEDVLAAWPVVHTSNLSHDELRTLIDRAGNRINAELCRRYGVPFATDPASAPPLIKDLTVDLAMMDLLYRAAQPTDFVVQRLTNAQNLLGRIAAGEVCVLDTDGGTIAQTSVGGITSNTSQYVPVFGSHPSLRERTDPTRVDDEDARRD